MSQTKVEAPFVEGGGGSTFKNLLINGDLKIAQRATSVAISGNSDEYGNIDRWKCRLYNLGAFTVSQSTTVPTGEGFVSSQKWDCTTADASPASTDYAIFEQRMEGQNLQHLAYGTSSAKKLTASFWVRSNKTGVFTVGLYSADGSRHIASSYTISSADTWEKKKVTFAGDTGGTINNDNGEALRLWFWLGAGTNFSSGTHATSWAAYAQANVLADNQVNLADSTDNEWYITGIQLEVGDDASDFEHIPQDVQFNRCCRYYYKIASGLVKLGDGANYTSSQLYFPVFIPNKLRTTGSIGGVGGTGYFQFFRNGAADPFDEVSLWGTRDNLVYMRSVGGTISGTAGHGGMVSIANSSAVIEIGAEL